LRLQGLSWRDNRNLLGGWKWMETRLGGLLFGVFIGPEGFVATGAGITQLFKFYSYSRIITAFSRGC
jgi:hypothetical protein